MYGTVKGDIVLCDIVNNTQEGIWNTYKSLIKFGTSKAIKDIVCSPGEDVFLALRADDQMYLYGIVLD